MDDITAASKHVCKYNMKLQQVSVRQMIHNSMLSVENSDWCVLVLTSCPSTEMLCSSEVITASEVNYLTRGLV